MIEWNGRHIGWVSSYLIDENYKGETQMWLYNAGTDVIKRGETPIFYHAEGVEWPKNKNLMGEYEVSYECSIPDEGWEQKNISEKP